VAFAKNGDVYVADGYGNSRIVKFDRDGNYIKAWGKYGTGPGEFNLPHSVAVDKQGRLTSAIEKTSAYKFLMQTASSSNSGPELVIHMVW
jgi:DNA-binding beta-propeller fold protein YncE